MKLNIVPTFIIVETEIIYIKLQNNKGIKVIIVKIF